MIVSCRQRKRIWCAEPVPAVVGGRPFHPAVYDGRNLRTKSLLGDKANQYLCYCFAVGQDLFHRHPRSRLSFMASSKSPQAQSAQLSDAVSPTQQQSVGQETTTSEAAANTEESTSVGQGSVALGAGQDVEAAPAIEVDDLDDDSAFGGSDS